MSTKMTHQIFTKIMIFFRSHWHVAVVMSVLVAVATLLLMTEGGHRRDEKVHSRVIKDMYQGDMVPMEGLTNIPGYHWAMTGVLHVMDTVYDFEEKPKHPQIRFVSMAVFGTLFVIVWYRLLHALGKQREELFVVMTMPLVFLFTLTVYTDIPALMLFFAGYYFVVARKHVLAAALFALTLLVRQDMITYIAGIVALAVYADAMGGRMRWPRVSDVGGLVRAALSTRLVPYYALAIAFVAFIIINGGVAVGDKNAHPTTITWGNVYNFFLWCALMFAPVMIAHIKDVWHVMRRTWRWTVPAVVMGWFFYDWSFVIDHAYNYVIGFLHNDIVMAIAQSDVWRVVSYGVVVWTVLTLAVMRWRDKGAVVFMAPIVLVSLSLHWLIEPRYSMTALLLVALWHQWDRRTLWWQIAYGVAWCVYVYLVFLAQDNYFL